MPNHSSRSSRFVPGVGSAGSSTFCVLDASTCELNEAAMTSSPSPPIALRNVRYGVPSDCLSFATEAARLVAGSHWPQISWLTTSSAKASSTIAETTGASSGVTGKTWT